MTLKTLYTCALCLMISGVASAFEEDAPVEPKTPLRPNLTVLLYPEGQAAGKGIVENGVQITPGATIDNGLRGPETCSASGSRKNVGDKARIDIYLPENCNGIMVVNTPGGGYSHLSTFNEGAYGADFLVSKGFAVCVLKYRLPNRHPGVPIEDVHNTFRYLRHHAAEWGVKLIGVMGGSAGGHLSSTASVLWTDEVTRPDFAVLLYPRISLYKGETTSTKNNLIGTDEEWADRPEEHAKLLEYWSPDTHINAQTPPTFIALSADDVSVNPRNYLPYYINLTENDVPVEVHVYPRGGHGWGFSTDKIKGPGKDKLGACRPEFETALVRWLLDRLPKNE